MASRSRRRNPGNLPQQAASEQVEARPQHDVPSVATAVRPSASQQGQEQPRQPLPPELISALQNFGCRAASRLGTFFAENNIHPRDGRQFTRETLLGIAALLQIEEWQSIGVLDAIGESVPLTVPQLRALAMTLLHGDETPGIRLHSAILSMNMLRVWAENFAWEGHEILGGDVGISGSLEDDLLEELAVFLWDHRHQLSEGETS